ncbi:MAG: ATP-binding cassette domain-containing protein [Kordiimonadaceae bacterium]|jgi:ABC-type Mn2+/Zn2+ transport system ATPase subunit|nr:ATP-binding cassette domain-containing protein [Kordiimonadaceae bacterium]
MSLNISSGNHEFGNAQGRIKYNVTGNNGDPRQLLADIDDERTNFQFSIIAGTSGSGKTTLIKRLYDYLLAVRENTETARDTLFNASNLDDLANTSLELGYIPQKAQPVLHWRVSELVPRQPDFFKCLFPEEDAAHLDFNATDRGEIGRYSGGQGSRIYICSVLERLFHRKATNNILILDEAFDGVNSDTAGLCLESIMTRWKVIAPDRRLFVIVITHLNTDKIIERVAPVFLTNSIKLSPQIKARDDADRRVFTVNIQ